jgi:hypothetical protein
MGGLCSSSGPKGDKGIQGNGLGGNNVAGAGMSLNDIARTIAYASQGLADPRTIATTMWMRRRSPDPSPAVDAAVNAACGTDAQPVGAAGGAPSGNGNCNCTDD